MQKAQVPNYIKQKANDYLSRKLVMKMIRMVWNDFGNLSIIDFINLINNKLMKHQHNSIASYNSSDRNDNSQVALKTENSDIQLKFANASKYRENLAKNNFFYGI